MSRVSLGAGGLMLSTAFRVGFPPEADGRRGLSPSPQLYTSMAASLLDVLCKAEVTELLEDEGSGLLAP